MPGLSCDRFGLSCDRFGLSCDRSGLSSDRSGLSCDMSGLSYEKSRLSCDRFWLRPLSVSGLMPESLLQEWTPGWLLAVLAEQQPSCLPSSAPLGPSTDTRQVKFSWL